MFSSGPGQVGDQCVAGPYVTVHPSYSLSGAHAYTVIASGLSVTFSLSLSPSLLLELRHCNIVVN